MSNEILKQNILKRRATIHKKRALTGSLKVEDHPVTNMVFINTENALLHLTIIRQRRNKHTDYDIYPYIYQCSLSLNWR